jgi:YesN/AraC family two-component response regulator
MKASDNIRVLIAEDDFLVSREISRTVKKIGYEVIAEVSDGEDAIITTTKLRPDVVLMDIQMPGMDGLRASEAITQKCPTPIVVISAHESQDIVKKASRSGVGSFLTKPPKQLEIERAIIISMARHEDLMAYRKLNERLEKRTLELEKALAKVKTLSGLLPICASCKKIRDDKGYWNQIESYLQQHSEAEFSHGICPECMKELYPEIAYKMKDKIEY